MLHKVEGWLLFLVLFKFVPWLKTCLALTWTTLKDPTGPSVSPEAPWHNLRLSNDSQKDFSKIFVCHHHYRRGEGRESHGARVEVRRQSWGASSLFLPLHGSWGQNQVVRLVWPMPFPERHDPLEGEIKPGLSLVSGGARKPSSSPPG